MKINQNDFFFPKFSASNREQVERAKTEREFIFDQARRNPNITIINPWETGEIKWIQNRYR